MRTGPSEPRLPVLAVVADVTVEVAEARSAGSRCAVDGSSQSWPFSRPAKWWKLAQVIQTAPPRSRRTQAPSARSRSPNTLPATSSSLPLIALCGLLALGGGFDPAIHKHEV